MKQEVWAQKSVAHLESKGFVKIKPHVYWCVRDEMLFAINFQGKKNDIYTWHAIYPLAMPEIWPSVGHGNAAGRIPVEEGTLCIKSENEIQNIQVAIEKIILNKILPKFEKIKTLEDLSELLHPDKNHPIAQFPRAYCLFSLGKAEQGYKALEQLLSLPYMKDSALVGDKIMPTLEINRAEISDHIIQLRAANIKKLRLKKCMKSI